MILVSNSIPRLCDSWKKKNASISITMTTTSTTRESKTYDDDQRVLLLVMDPVIIKFDRLFTTHSSVSWAGQPERAESAQPRKVVMYGEECTSRLASCQYTVHLL